MGETTIYEGPKSRVICIEEEGGTVAWWLAQSRDGACWRTFSEHAAPMWDAARRTEAATQALRQADAAEALAR